jgi:hypothetical protein
LSIACDKFSPQTPEVKGHDKGLENVQILLVGDVLAYHVLAQVWVFPRKMIPVLWIRMFLDLPDLDPSLFVWTRILPFVTSL